MSESLVAHSSTFAPAMFRRSLGDALELARGVDAVAVEERAASLAKRSLKKKQRGGGRSRPTAISDSTPPEAKTPPGKVRPPGQKPTRPDPPDTTFRHVAP